MKPKHLLLVFSFLISFAVIGAELRLQQPLYNEHKLSGSDDDPNRRVSAELFWSLEELSRLADIAYCVGSTGIRKPFTCSNHCDKFEGFELITTWNTGPLLSDSCGYIALSHLPDQKRIIVAFRGSYSISNAIVDLSAVPQVYVPYPGTGDGDNEGPSDKCDNCTVHAGFLASWQNAREEIIPHLSSVASQYPDYELILVGHSLGGAVAGLAALELRARGWKPQVTTFGEPRIGNEELAHYFDARFSPDPDARRFSWSTWLGDKEKGNTYRRVTHIKDPVPLLPIEEAGYRMHGGEIFISKKDVPPSVPDLEHCEGDNDPRCIAGEVSAAVVMELQSQIQKELEESRRVAIQDSSAEGIFPFPPALKFWELFFSHRDYFWRLGICLPGMKDSN